jgi:branched-chain amino acid transport system substrate-binding protein
MKVVIRGIAAALITVAAVAAYAQTPGVVGKTIKIGMSGPLTGSLSIWGYPMLHGATMVYKEVNAKGGIHGRTIDFVEEDDSCDPAKALAAAKKLIHRDRVFMVHAGSCSGAIMAQREEVVATKTPLMVLVASLHQISSPLSPYIFTVSPTGLHDGKTMGEFAVSMPNAKTVAIIAHSDEWAKSKVDPFKAAVSGKLKVVAEEIVDRRATDTTAQILNIKRSNPDIVALMTYPGETATVLRDAQKYGLETQFVGNNALIDLPGLVERTGSAEAVQNVYVMASIIGPVGSKELAPFEAMLKKHYPDDKAKAESFWGTASALVVVEALRRAGPDLTREKFIAALESIRGFETGVAPCKIDLSPTNHQGCQVQTAWKLDKSGRVTAVGLKWRQVD